MYTLYVIPGINTISQRSNMWNIENIQFSTKLITNSLALDTPECITTFQLPRVPSEDKESTGLTANLANA